ncbi:DUF3365 domain-containing protein [Pseudomonas sp. GOM6]|uniref:Tll0287-like domain-containing protein n=1 Tax=Pseudomonas sp. GOM6 TaxID=3036944 RepID=UPI002408FB91|nr:DUF3365 domain-containing protein [Pseudomonas sp. GOM6]MDG1582266.1 DUF3365 domain-containing protein [Pseudomonas sp. GOM6]
MRLFTLLLCWAPLLAQATDLAQLRSEAEALIPPFQQQLLASVQTAVTAGGPTQAVEACRQLAPGIAQQHSVAPWTVGRTALRLRNPDNRPDAWEQAVLEDFQRRSQAGEAVARLNRAEVVGGEFRYMRAIATGEPCLACHGSAIKPELVQLLDRHYPQDQARGFTAGELRGAFTLRRPLEP